jgi:hypothetical protein
VRLVRASLVKMCEMCAFTVGHGHVQCGADLGIGMALGHADHDITLTRAEGGLGNGVHTATTLAPAGMHLAVGAVLIPALRRSAH